ncbi:MAG: NADH-quinone oxidoreductase subunit J, partial [Clostridia bacterium]|nr:NADH-quinone oxidoreductase subunit J [Clostridia bacterium]
MELTSLAEIMKNGGIVGAGGAGFPSYAKLDKRADTIVLNCAECEPLFNLHRQLLANFAKEILTALEEVRKAIEAKNVVIAIKPAYTNAIEAVKYYLPEFKNTTIALLPEIYPAG